jgi:hypothetical protein
MLENIAGSVSLFLGTTVALYIFTKPQKDGDKDYSNRVISFKGAMKYSPAAMRQKSFMDEMDM